MNTEIIKGEINSAPFDIVTDANILTGEDLKILSSLSVELQDTFKKSQVFRTRTEMEVSVLNDIQFPTHASKYWQAVREQNVMFHELVTLSYEYRKNLVEIKILERDMDVETDDLKKELLKIEMERKSFAARNQEKVAKDRIREMKAWSEIKERESENMHVEELKDADTHQLMSYTLRWLRQAIEIGDRGSVDERKNLFGQLYSALQACKDNGLLEEILKKMPHSSKIIQMFLGSK